MKCECECACHFNPVVQFKHKYGVDFSPVFTKLVKTVMGTFRVCMDCATLCEGYNA